MAGQITNTAELSIIATENSTSVVPVNRSLEADMSATYGDYYYTTVANGGIQDIQLLPGTKVFQLFVRNLAADGSNQVVGVFQKRGASPYRLLTVLGPGDFFCNWCRNNSSATIVDPTDGAEAPGYVEIGLLSNAAAVPCEYFVGGN